MTFKELKDALINLDVDEDAEVMVESFGEYPIVLVEALSSKLVILMIASEDERDENNNVVG